MRFLDFNVSWPIASVLLLVVSVASCQGGRPCCYVGERVGFGESLGLSPPEATCRDPEWKCAPTLEAGSPAWSTPPDDFSEGYTCHSIYGEKLKVPPYMNLYGRLQFHGRNSRGRYGLQYFCTDEDLYSILNSEGSR